MQVDNLMVNEGAADLYTDSLRYTIESFIPYLRAHPDTQTLEIAPNDALRFEFDLRGLLMNLQNMTPDMIWVTMRTNYLTCETDYTAKMLALLIPSAAVVNQIRQGDQAVNRISS